MTTIRQLIKIPVSALIASYVLLAHSPVAQAQGEPSQAAQAYALHEDLLKCYQTLGKTEETEGEYKWLLAARPTAAVYHFNYAVFLQHEGRKGPAALEYEKAAMYDGTNTDFLGSAGQMFFFMGNCTKAYQYLSKATQMPGGDKYRASGEACKAYMEGPILYDALPPRKSRPGPHVPNDDDDH